jgi:hypothetical protein
MTAGAFSALGCGYSTSEVGQDARCSDAVDFELKSINNYENEKAVITDWGAPFFDKIPGAFMRLGIAEIVREDEAGNKLVGRPCTGLVTYPNLAEDDMAPADACQTATGGRCELAEKAVVIRGGGSNWFGSGATVSLLQNGEAFNAFGYEGLAFWARAVGDAGWVFSLADGHSDGDVPSLDGVRCSKATGAEVPQEEKCGNSWRFFVTFSHEWKLHRIPWHAMRQSVVNKVFLEGIDTTNLKRLSLDAPVAFVGELWIDEIAVYKRIPEDQ